MEYSQTIKITFCRPSLKNFRRDSPLNIPLMSV